MRVFHSVAASILAFGLASGANAATFKAVTDGVFGSGIDPVFGFTTEQIVSFAGDPYADEVDGAEWVWVGTTANDIQDIDSAVFQYSFNLTSAEVATTSLRGVWGADNYGEVWLNFGTASATRLSALEYIQNAASGSPEAAQNFANFATLTPYGSNTGFVAGKNTVTYFIYDREFLEANSTGINGAAFLASLEVNTIPLPAGSVLGLSALAMLGGLRVMRRRRAES